MIAKKNFPENVGTNDSILLNKNNQSTNHKK